MKVRENTKYVTSKIPILFVHGFVALKVEGGDQNKFCREVQSLFLRA